MKTQLELSTDLIQNHKCPACGDHVSLVQHGQHQWAVECSSIDKKDEDDPSMCGYMLVDDTMQGAYDKFAKAAL